MRPLNVKRIGLTVLAALPFCSTAQTNPVTHLPTRRRDIFYRADMPEIPSRSQANFAPTALRFGTGEKDIAFFLFDSRRRGERLPDTVFVWIPEHPEYTEPKPFRGRTVQDGRQMEFRDIVIVSEDAGVKRRVTVHVAKNRGETGFIAYEVTMDAEYQGRRTVIAYGQRPTFATMYKDKSRVRVQTLLEEPQLLLRVAGDGTEVACSLRMGREWFLLPRDGMETAITVEVEDSAGQIVATHQIPANPKTWLEDYSWTLRLRNLKNDEQYRVHARIHLGPWLGELKQSVTTQWTDRRN